MFASPPPTDTYWCRGTSGGSCGGKTGEVWASGGGYHHPGVRAGLLTGFQTRQESCIHKN